MGISASLTAAFRTFAWTVPSVRVRATWAILAQPTPTATRTAATISASCQVMAALMTLWVQIALRHELVKVGAVLRTQTNASIAVSRSLERTVQVTLPANQDAVSIIFA